MPDSISLPRPVETIFWLIRHPEPEASAKGRCYGSLDVDLSAAGIGQAHQIAKALASEPLAAIYTSPRRRCTEAARILAAGRNCTVETLDTLRELDFGEFEGCSYDEIAAQHPEFYREWMERPTAVRFPGGENFADMRARVDDALRELRQRHPGDSVGLVTHGGTIRILLAGALGMEPANIFRLGQRYGAINRLRYLADSPVVDLVNG